MKSKMLLSLTIVIFSSIAVLQAQIEKKDWLLGGSLGFNTSNPNSGSSNYSTSNANFAPHIGYAIGHNSVIGLNIGFNYSNTSSQYKSVSFSTNAFYKKFISLKEKFGIYYQINAGIGWSQVSYPISDSTGNVTSKITYPSHAYNASITPGVYYAVSPKILLNADCGGLGYNYSDNGDGYGTSNFAFNFLSSFTFGVDFILGRKKS
jgi:hypothetical protein